MERHHRSPLVVSKLAKLVELVRRKKSFSSLFFINIVSLTGGNFESGLAEGAGGAYGASSFESSSYSSSVGGGAAGGYGGLSRDANFTGGYGGSSYESSSYGVGGGATSGSGFDVVAAAFNNADKNKDGSVDANEFKQFYQGGL